MILLLTCFVIVCYLIISTIDLIKHRRGYNITGPIPLPLIGNGLLFVVKTSEVLSLLQRLSIQYGDAFLVYFLNRPYVMLTHPQFIEPVLMSSELLTKGKAYNFVKPWLGEGLLTASGQNWKDHRRFLNPAFHFNIIQNFLPVFNKNGRILLDKLDRLPDGKPVDLFPIISMATLDNVTEAIIGKCVNSQMATVSEYAESITTLTHIIATRVLVPILSNDFIFSLTSYKKQQDAAIEFLRDYVKNIVNERKQCHKAMNVTTLQMSDGLGIKEKHTFLDLLLLAKMDGQRLDEKTILSEVETFVFAGQDTTTSGIVFSLYCLSQYQDVQDKVFKEQKSIFGDDLNRDVTHADLVQMKYLELVIKESTRMYPPVPMIEREITQNVEVGGLKLRRGTTLSLNLFLMHRHPDVYKDPLEFKPERFAADSNESKKPYYVFSAGPRNCIGQKFAMLELKVVLSEITRRFKILPVEQDIQPCADIVLRAATGVYVKFARR